MRKCVCGFVAPCGMSAVLLRAIVTLISLALILVPFAAFAHSGGTDDYGGHIVKKTGAYHFHHGHSAHSHENGVCPYGDYEEFLNSEGFDVEQLDTLYVNRGGVPYDTIIAYIAPSRAPKPSPSTAPTASPSPSPSPTACSTPTLNPTVFALPSPSPAVKSASIAGASPYPMLVVVITALPSQRPSQDSYTVPAPTANAAVTETPAPDLSLHVDGTSITFSFDWANMLYIFLGLAVVFIFVRAVKRWSKR